MSICYIVYPYNPKASTPEEGKFRGKITPKQECQYLVLQVFPQEKSAEAVKIRRIKLFDLLKVQHDLYYWLAIYCKKIAARFDNALF